MPRWRLCRRPKVVHGEPVTPSSQNHGNTRATAAHGSAFHQRADRIPVIWLRLPWRTGLLNNSDATVVPIAQGSASGLSCPRSPSLGMEGIPGMAVRTLKQPPARVHRPYGSAGFRTYGVPRGIAHAGHGTTPQPLRNGGRPLHHSWRAGAVLSVRRREVPLPPRGRGSYAPCSCASAALSDQAHRSPPCPHCRGVRLCPWCNGAQCLTAAEQTRCRELLGKLTVRRKG